MAHVINKKTLLQKRRVDSSKYNTDEWIINPVFPDAPKYYWKIDGDQVVEKSQEEKDAYDLAVSTSNFESVKSKKLLAIDTKTRELISNGFVFDDVTFSLSDKAQFNWNALQASVANGLLTEDDFPYAVTTKDDDTYEIAWADFLTFIGTGLTTVGTHMATGRALKKQVLEATTIEEINAVVDER